MQVGSTSYQHLSNTEDIYEKNARWNKKMRFCSIVSALTAIGLFAATISNSTMVDNEVQVNLAGSFEGIASSFLFAATFFTCLFRKPESRQQEEEEKVRTVFHSTLH